MRLAQKALANGLRAFVNRGPLELFRFIATALAIVVVVFGVAAALGGLGRAAQSSILDGRLIGEIAARLTVTLEPVLISFFVASALAFVLSLSSAAVLPRVAVTVLVMALQSLPVFVFAIIVEMLFVVYLGLPIGSCRTPCTLSRHLALLVVPVVVLTTYQLPFLVKFFDGRRVRDRGAEVDEKSTLAGLAMLFADKLPSLISAAMIGEIIYGWAGEGRWLGLPDSMFGGRGAPAFTLFLILNALVVALIRCIIGLLLQPRRIVTDATG